MAEILAVASLAVGVVSFFAQQGAAADSRAAQKEQGEVQTASQTIRRQDSTRRAVRAARVQRARILQSSSNTGSGTSSGVSGAISGLRTKLDSASATVSGEVKTAQSLSDLSQKDADARYTAQVWQGISNVFNSTATAASNNPGIFQFG